MDVRFTSLLVACTILSTAIRGNWGKSKTKQAVCRMEAHSGVGTAEGVILLTDLTNYAGPGAQHGLTGVEFEGVLFSLSPGLHGFHVHENGNLGALCNNTLQHFNPLKVDHGGLTDYTRHVGDLGNIMSDLNGVAFIQLFSDKASLHGVNSILGRALVVHAVADDLGRGNNPTSKMNGNSGGRLGCCVIKEFKNNQ